MKPATPASDETIGDVRDIAAGWFARQRAGDMGEAERQALRAWLDADPDHRVAYAAIRRAWGGAAALRADPLVLEIREHWSASHQRRRQGAVMRTAATWVAGAVIAAGGGGVGWHLLSGPHPLVDQSFRTAVGQRSTVSLPDGSELTLNTDTVVRTRADRDRRLVYLERGQAYFRVAKDRDHPFVVAAAGRTVTAVGTAFDVRVDQGRFKVTLVEGKVRVEAPLPAAASPGPAAHAPDPDGGGRSVEAADMTAGTQLVATAQAPWRVSPANVIVETSWTKDLLIFDNQPLGEVLGELNRYSTKKIVLADPKIASIPISGTFRTGDVDSFVRTVQAYRLAKAGEDTAEAVQLRAY